MKEILEQSSFKVEIASLSTEPFSVGSIMIEPDLKLSDVDIENYSGFIFFLYGTSMGKDKQPESGSSILYQKNF